MNITRDEAVAALREVEGAETRAVLYRSYRSGAPHLILWGLVWALGYTLTGVLPHGLIGPMWLVIDLIGLAVALGLNRRAASRFPFAAKGRLWFASLIAIWLFFVATYVVMRPHSNEQYEIYPALVVSLIYALVGAWGRPRYLWIGAAVFVLSMLGFFFLKPVLPFWLAAVGGGSLILGGVWLRQA